MAYAFGLVLAPFGGLIGALILGVLIILFDPRGWTADLLPTLLLLGIPFGALFAAPTTLIALPVAHSVLSEEPGSHAAGLAATGLVSGALTMFLLCALTLGRTDRRWTVTSSQSCSLAAFQGRPAAMGWI